MESILGILVVVAILGGSALLTQLYARWAYLKCSSCGALNARRRQVCRNCGGELRQKA